MFLQGVKVQNKAVYCWFLHAVVAVARKRICFYRHLTDRNLKNIFGIINVTGLHPPIGFDQKVSEHSVKAPSSFNSHPSIHPSITVFPTSAQPAFSLCFGEKVQNGEDRFVSS